VLHKKYEEAHILGYTLKEIEDAVKYIFDSYDKNKDGLLDQNEVKALIENSLKQMGSSHQPSNL